MVGRRRGVAVAEGLDPGRASLRILGFRHARQKQLPAVERRERGESSGGVLDGVRHDVPAAGRDISRIAAAPLSYVRARDYRVTLLLRAGWRRAHER